MKTLYRYLVGPRQVRKQQVGLFEEKPRLKLRKKATFYTRKEQRPYSAWRTNRHLRK